MEKGMGQIIRNGCECQRYLYDCCQQIDLSGSVANDLSAFSVLKVLCRKHCFEQEERGGFSHSSIVIREQELSTAIFHSP
jgi:hypothetical protein